MPDLHVLLLGDSLRLSYQARVKTLLAQDGLTLDGPAGSTGNSRACREGAEAWLNTYRPDLVCFAAGPHAADDAHLIATTGGRLEPVDLADYEGDILHLGELFRRHCGRQVVFVTMPPVHVERFVAAHARHGAGTAAAGRDLAQSLNRSIKQYNDLAFTLLGQLNIMVTRLGDLLSPRADDCLADDGVHLSPAGVELAARMVVGGILGVV
jgi:hypothetical protein